LGAFCFSQTVLSSDLKTTVLGSTSRINMTGQE